MFWRKPFPSARISMAGMLGPFLFTPVMAQPAHPVEPAPATGPVLSTPVPGARPTFPGGDGSSEQGRALAPANATSVFDGAAPAPQATTLLEEVFQIGPFQVRPHADYTFTYGNGVSTSPGTQHTTAHHRISPGLLLQGAHVSIDYTPSLNYYSHEAFEDTLEHSAFLNALYSAGEWDFRLRQSYSKINSPLVETGMQTITETHFTNLGASYRYNEKISFDLNLDQRLQSVEGFTDSRQWSTTDWINYHATDRTTFGFGGALGYVHLSAGSDMTFEHLLGRISTAFSEKLSGEVGGGVEFRQFLDDDVTRVNPLMNARLTYQLWATTALSLTANRSVDTSLYEGAITESTHFQAMLQQRLLGRLHFNLTAGYRMSEHQAAGVFAEVDRSDDLATVSVSLAATILARGSASVFFRHSTNDSTSELYTFSSDQVGFQLGYRF